MTREIARSPSSGADSDFDWRVSIAEVATGGPFSRFPGIDRVLIRIGEAPLALVIAGRERVAGTIRAVHIRWRGRDFREPPGGADQ